MVFADALISGIKNVSLWIDQHLKRFDHLLPPVTVQRMSYRDAVAYFVDHRPNDPRIASGAIMLQETPKGRMTYWLFLDANGEVLTDMQGKPFGRKMLVHQFDSELQQVFNGKSLLVIS